MQITVLLGPAGSGKTYRCLEQVRSELKRAPDGAPLIFLTPKQATYQIERDLLADPDLPGFTRLKVVGFETLAEFILQELASTHPVVLGDLGRVMVLRALLTQHDAHLKTFHASARMPGFAQQLGTVFSEIQHAGLSPEQLRVAAAQKISIELRDKLLDFAHLLGAYTEWLDRNHLYDPNRLLALAASALNDADSKSVFQLGGLWLDGFAELSEQELELLAAVAGRSECATMAFCSDVAPHHEMPWHSAWNGISRTVKRCQPRLAAVAGADLNIEHLKRSAVHSRFADPALAHLEQHWASGTPFRSQIDSTPDLPLFADPPAVKLLRCQNPAEEAAVCAREILGFVRVGKRRFRDVAVILRSLRGYDDILGRVFSQYEIPFFVDRRQPVAHHPVAELIRYALRLVADGWLQDDWFGALKTGLLIVDNDLVDLLENTALARGWDGERWLQPLPPPFDKLPFVPAFVQFARTTQQALTGPQLAAALRAFFEDLKVAEHLQRWSDEATEGQGLLHSEIHEAVWETIGDWLDNIELAFESAALPLKAWLPIVEAGLANLTVGVIPPSLDQVLIGTVDRSRNPELKMAIVLGLNEMVFPAPPPDPPLLNEYDREVLRGGGIKFGRSTQEHLSLEQYLAYIACTRARERLVLMYAERDARDKPLNPSSIIQHVQDLLPQLREALPSFDWRHHAAHASDVVVPLLRHTRALPPTQSPGFTRLSHLPVFAPVLKRWRSYHEASNTKALPPALLEKLYGPELDVSVSQLEDYAACAFKFFVLRALRAEEREEFKVDRRLRGTFQHDVLQKFHEWLTANGKRWRDITLEQARSLVRQIGPQVQETLQDGVFLSTPEWRFAAETLIEGLQRLVTVLVGWAPQYDFDPCVVELGFGRDGPLPSWKIDLGNGHVLALRGRIDRVDVLRTDSGEGWMVVMDYKAGGQKIDDLRITNGLDLQLLAYLAALRGLPEAQALLRCAKMLPAGGFYLTLRPSQRSAKNRDEALEQSSDLYQHVGRFRADLLSRFDNRNQSKGDQFKYEVTRAGALHQRCKDPLPGPDFEGLVNNTEDLLREFGRAIYSGHVPVNPFRHKQQTACERCDFASVCRFDPWEKEFRALSSVRRIAEPQS